jgi:hypothetical protein
MKGSYTFLQCKPVFRKTLFAIKYVCQKNASKKV